MCPDQRVRHLIRRHGLVIVIDVPWLLVEQVHLPAEVVRQRVAERPTDGLPEYLPPVIHPGGRGGPGLGCVLDDIAVQEAQRHDVSRSVPSGLDLQQCRVRLVSSSLPSSPMIRNSRSPVTPCCPSRISLVPCIRMPLTGAIALGNGDRHSHTSCF